MIISHLQVISLCAFIFLLISWFISLDKYLSSINHYRLSPWQNEALQQQSWPLMKQGSFQYDANLGLFISTCKRVDSYTWLFPYLFLIRSQVSFSQIKVKVKENKAQVLTLQWKDKLLWAACSLKLLCFLCTDDVLHFPSIYFTELQNILSLAGLDL